VSQGSEQSTLDRHELDFIARAEFQSSAVNSPHLDDILDPHRWSRAASLLVPRSRFGSVFGVTNRDIESAARRLENPAALSPAQRTLKRLADVIVSSFLLVLLSPALIAVAAALRVDAGGPVMYRQERIGKDGKVFHMLKFKTLLTSPDGDPSAEPRISRIGRHLRRYSLDEIPQLLNVLGGSMSIVGPRPSLVAEDAESSGLRPGITGLWTLRELRMQGDSYYRENWSLALDAQILWRTMRYVAHDPNAVDPN
jgi:lipopolysaccharide/colanic/teichoic acid biosynthesis glycosyltransferase